MATATARATDSHDTPTRSRTDAPAAGPPDVDWSIDLPETVNGPVVGVSIAINSHAHVVAAYQEENGEVWAATGRWSADSLELGTFAAVEKGTCPCVAINTAEQIVLVYQSGSTDLMVRLGTWGEDGISWQTDPAQYDLGAEPSVAIDFEGRVVEAHKSENRQALFYNVGQIASGGITFLNNGGVPYKGGVTPSIALNDNGQVVELHHTQIPGRNGLFYQLGQVQGSEIVGLDGDSTSFKNGSSPSVAINNAGDVVFAWVDDGNALRFKPGVIESGTIDFNKRETSIDSQQVVAVGMSLGQDFVGALSAADSDTLNTIAGTLES